MKMRKMLWLPVALVAVLALAFGSVGGASAGETVGKMTKSKVKKIAAKVVAKQAPTLSVAHATTATTATTATNADGVTDGSITGADLAAGLKTFTSARKTCTAGPDLVSDGTTFKTCTIAAPELTAPVIATDAVSVTFTMFGNEVPLPYTSTAGGEMNTLSYLLMPGTITFVRSSADATPPGTSTSLGFKYSIVPNSAGAAPVARSGGGTSSVN